MFFIAYAFKGQILVFAGQVKIAIIIVYFQRETHLAKKKLIFHEALYELPSKNNTSIKYKDDLHVYKIIQTSWNTFKPTYTQAYFFT